MQRFWTRFAVVVCLAIPALHGFALAQSPLPAGREFQVNSYTTGSQTYAAVGKASDGSFVVAWQSIGQDGSNAGVFARRFGRSGVGQSVEFQVNTYTTDHQFRPAVGMASDGDFVVAWSSAGQDGSNYGVFARRFNAAGIAQGGAFQVNTYITDSQYRPALGMASDGAFVIAWSSYGQDGSDYGIFAQRFSAAGVAQGGEFQVNTYTSDYQYGAAVGMASNGSFVVTWSSLDGSGYGVFARLFSAAGVAQGVEFQVNKYTSNSQYTSAVGMASDGDFVVAWASIGQDYSSTGVFAQRFDSAGIVQGDEFQVNAYTTAYQHSPAVGVANDGGFVVAWRTYAQDGHQGAVFARRFDAAGIAQAAEFQVNGYTSNNQINPAFGMAGDGDFVVAWQSFNQDGSGNGIFAQRYQAPAVLDIDGNSSVEPLTDGVLVLRYLFGFTGSTLIGGAVDTDGCMRCTAPMIEAYLATLI